MFLTTWCLLKLLLIFFRGSYEILKNVDIQYSDFVVVANLKTIFKYVDTMVSGRGKRKMKVRENENEINALKRYTQLPKSVGPFSS